MLGVVPVLLFVWEMSMPRECESEGNAGVGECDCVELCFRNHI